MTPNKTSYLWWFFPVAVGTLLLSGCTTIPSSRSIPSATSSLNFIGTGKVLFHQPGQSYSGDLELRFGGKLDLRLQIFTPLVGTLIYEVRADQARLMVLDYQAGWYVLEPNNRRSRRKWLGMDLSLEELGWLLHGKERIPPQSEWKIIRDSPGELQLQSGEVELRIQFDDLGRIRFLEKQSAGFPEYQLLIPSYQTETAQLTPRRLKIEDFSGTHQLQLVFSEVLRPSMFVNPISFEPPEDLNPFVQE